VPTFVVRVWLPDRPGALGQVASRIGALRGDVVGIDILERGAGRAVDELFVALPDPEVLDLLITEIGQVDGVDVEDVRPLTSERHDPGLAALDLAASLVGAPDRASLLHRLVSEVAYEFDCDWAAAVTTSPPGLLEAVGDTPEVGWLAAFVEGSRHLGHDHHDEVTEHPDDLVWAGLTGTNAVVTAGRKGRPFRWRERRQLVLLARIAGSMLAGGVTAP
jgi:hypothetical protein